MKYYNIKIGQDIIGRVIQVDPDPKAELEDRVKDFIGDTEFEVTMSDDYGCAYYEEKHLPGSTAIGISIDEKENIGVYVDKFEDKKVHFREISEQEAKRLREYVHEGKQFQEWDNDV